MVDRIRKAAWPRTLPQVGSDREHSREAGCPPARTMFMFQWRSLPSPRQPIAAATMVAITMIGAPRPAPELLGHRALEGVWIELDVVWWGFARGDRVLIIAAPGTAGR